MEDLDALLADLQTSIPRGPSASQSPTPPSQQAYSPPPHQQPSPHPSPYSQHDSSHHRNFHPQQAPNSNGVAPFPHSSPSEPQYTNGDVDLRGSYPPKKVYYQESKEEVRTETRSSGPHPVGGSDATEGNELDSLLSELNSTRYSAAKERANGGPPERANGGPHAGAGVRPSVDSLLNELNSVSSSQQQSSRLVQQQQHSMAPQPVTASTATRDLDDLMAELSDFKEDRSWVAALEDQVDGTGKHHPEKVGAGTRNASQGVAASSYSKNYSYNTSSNTRGATGSTGGGSATSSPLTGRLSSEAASSSSKNYASNTKTSYSPTKPPGTPPPRPPTPRSLPTPPPRPPAPAEGSVVSIPLVLPCPGTPPPIPPPPVPASPSGSLKRRTPVIPPEPYERPDSGGPVKRNDNAYRWITDEVKYQIRELPEEEPPAIPDYVSQSPLSDCSTAGQNDNLRSPALVRKLLNRNDTYAKPEKPKSPSPPAPAFVPAPAPAFVPVPAPAPAPAPVFVRPPPPKEPSPPLANELDCMLGSLANHMTEQGVTTTQKGCCCACDKPIVGQVITALGKTWHPEHFTCAHCSSELGSKNFFERDGRPYCEACYHELFSPRCAYCDGSILDKCVTALDKNWHPDHFFCAQCGNTFGEEGFHEKDGKAYCREDYYNMFAPKCGGCNSPIMENYISALNAQWHPECFVCRDCRQPFNGGSFFDHEGMPYCETHYHAKRGSLCAGCHKPITGRCVTAMFRKYHPEHFTCSFCLRQLNKGTFKEQNDKPYCHGCFDKLYG